MLIWNQSSHLRFSCDLFLSSWNTLLPMRRTAENMANSANLITGLGVLTTAHKGLKVRALSCWCQAGVSACTRDARLRKERWVQIESCTTGHNSVTSYTDVTEWIMAVNIRGSGMERESLLKWKVQLSKQFLSYLFVQYFFRYIVQESSSGILNCVHLKLYQNWTVVDCHPPLVCYEWLSLLLAF